MAVFEWQHTMVAQPGRSAPHHNITVSDLHAHDFVGSVQATEHEYRWNAARNGDDRLVEILFVLVLMERQLGSSFISIDQTSIGDEPLKSGLCGRILGELVKDARHRRPFLAADRIDGIIAVTAAVRYPAKRSTVGHCDRHPMIAWRDHVAERSLGHQFVQSSHDRGFVPERESAQYHCTCV